MAAEAGIPSETAEALMKALAGELEEAVELSKKALVKYPESEQAMAVNLVITKRLEGRRALLEDLDRLHFPRRDFGAVVTVMDDIEIGYAIYGEGADEKGVFSDKWEEVKGHSNILLFFHGLPGSRLFFTPTMNSALLERHCTLLLLERPSYGLSSDVHKLTDSLWNDMVSEFLKAVGVDGDRKVNLIAYSGGCPYALSLGAGAAGRHFSSISIVSCPSPPIDGATQNLGAVEKIGYFFARTSSWLFEKCIAHESSKMLQDPIRFFYRDYMGGLSTGDAAAYLYSDQIERAFVLSVREMYGEKFEKGVRAEAKNYEYICNEWPFRLRDIKVPVNIWFGEEDSPSLIVAGSKHLASEISTSHLKSVEGEGHLVLFSHWDAILSQCLK